jgi:hypothetical protein
LILYNNPTDIFLRKLGALWQIDPVYKDYTHYFGARSKFDKKDGKVRTEFSLAWLPCNHFCNLEYNDFPIAKNDNILHTNHNYDRLYISRSEVRTSHKSF